MKYLTNVLNYEKRTEIVWEVDAAFNQNMNDETDL